MWTWTSFFVGLLLGGMLGVVLLALMTAGSRADDLAEPKANELCQKNHRWNQYSSTSHHTLLGGHPLPGNAWLITYLRPDEEEKQGQADL